MGQIDYIVKSYDSEKEFLEVANLNNLKVYGNLEDTNNTYQIISFIGCDFAIAIAYYDCNLELQIKLNNNILFLGFERNFICINISSSEILYEKNTLSVIYEFLIVNHLLIVICELEVYVFSIDGKYIWTIGFIDIIEDFKVIDDTFLCIQCANEEEYRYDIYTGKYVGN